MSKLAELYAQEITREGATLTLEDVPARLRQQVADAIARKEAEEGRADG
nr:hypothetical protein [uncultured Dysosmobacter sp.]